MTNQYVPRSTPIPNVFIEEIMPKIRDTEWRVLVVVVRATLGWVDPISGQRKRQAWLTNRELCRRTGRQSEAVSKAVDGLVRSRLIEVSDPAGNLMLTAQIRRRAHGRLYFGVHPGLLRHLLAK